MTRFKDQPIAVNPTGTDILIGTQNPSGSNIDHYFTLNQIASFVQSTLNALPNNQLISTSAGNLRIGSFSGTIDFTGSALTNLTALTATTSVNTDTISERTSATGVTIDGLLIKDNAINNATSTVAANRLYNDSNWNYPLNSTAPTDQQVLAYDLASGTIKFVTNEASGNVVGPASSTNNAIPIWDGTTGELLKDSNLLYASNQLGPTSGDFVISPADSSANIIFSSPGSGSVNSNCDIVITALKKLKTNLFDVTSGSSFNFSNRDFTNINQITAFQLIGTNSVLSDSFVATSNVTTPNITSQNTDINFSAKDFTNVGTINSGAISTTGDITIAAGNKLKTNIFDVTSGSSFNFSNRDITNINQLTAFQLIGTNSVLSDSFIATSNVTTPNIISTSDLTLSPNNGIVNIGGNLTTSDYIAYKHTAETYPRVMLTDGTGPTASDNGRIFIGNGLVATTAGVNLFYGGSAGSLTISQTSVGGGAATVDLIGGTLKAANITQGSSNINLSSGGLVTINTDLTGQGLIKSSRGSTGNSFFQGIVTGDSIARASFYTGTNQTAISLTNGTSTGTYLSFLGTAGRLRISSASNGTGSGFLDTNSGTIDANTYQNGSSAFTLDGTDLVLSGSTGIKFPTSGGTATALTYYERYTATVSLSGIWASSQNATLDITRTGTDVVARLYGGVLTTANTAATITAASGSIPTRFLGSNESIWSSYLRLPFLVRDNGTDKYGAIQINANGSFAIAAGASTTTAFAGSGSSGFPGQSFGWSL